MKLIVGLGNIGKEYEATRHNIGFMVLDELARRWGVNTWKNDRNALCGEYRIPEKVLLLKPTTYMNLSGESIRGLVDYFKVDEEQELLIIYDDISLPPGQIRIRKKGSAGGHNGMKSIIQHLGTDVFMRIKVGVGEKPKKYDLADYVLSHFTKEEREEMKEGYEKSAEAAAMILRGDVEAAMNEYNRKVKPKEA